MEQSWGREKGFLRLTLHEIKALVECADLSAISDGPIHRPPTSLELIEEGKANTNYIVEFADGIRVILRIYQKPAVHARLDTALSDLFASEPWMPGTIALPLREGLGEGCALMEWKSGRTMESLLAVGRSGEVLTAAEDIGRALARISGVHFDQAGFLNENLGVALPWPSAFDGLLGYLDQCLARLGGDIPVPARPEVEPALARGIREAFVQAGPSFDALPGVPCLVHGDFKASNLLIHEGRLTGVVDWEYAHSGTWLLSVGQLFRHDEHLPNGFAEAFANGFDPDGSRLPENWIQLSRTLDLVNLADFLGRPSTTTEQTVDLLRLIRRNLGDSTA